MLFVYKKQPSIFVEICGKKEKSSIILTQSREYTRKKSRCESWSYVSEHVCDLFAIERVNFLYESKENARKYALKAVDHCEKEIFQLLIDINKAKKSSEKKYLEAKYKDVSEKMGLSYFCYGQELETTQEYEKAIDIYAKGLKTMENAEMSSTGLANKLAKARAILIDRKISSIHDRKNKKYDPIRSSDLEFAELEEPFEKTHLKGKNSQFTLKTKTKTKEKRPMSSAIAGKHIINK